MWCGQFETDKYIAEHFPKDYIGTCIEVGACDGYMMSNTLYFERLGWNCVCIEPNPDLFNALKVNRKIAENFAVGESNIDNLSFSVVTLEGGNTTAISSLRLDQRLLNDHRMNKTIHTVPVNQRTLDFILDRHPLDKIDFISIDTEGTELDVLKGFSVSKWFPRLFVIENNYNDPYIEEYLKDFGYYKSNRVVINDFYVRE